MRKVIDRLTEISKGISQNNLNGINTSNQNIASSNNESKKISRQSQQLQLMSNTSPTAIKSFALIKELDENAHGEVERQKKNEKNVNVTGSVQNINFEEETSCFMQRGSLDSANVLRVLLTRSGYDTLTTKEKALYYLFMKSEISLRNHAEANMVIYILRKQVKNNLENKYLYSVIQNIEIFKQNPELMSHSISSNSLFKLLKHEFFPRRTILFNYGDFGSKYYIVIKGSVYCLIPDTKFTESQKNHIRQSISLQNQHQQEQNPPHNPVEEPKILKVLSSYQAKKKTIEALKQMGVAEEFLNQLKAQQNETDEEFLKRKFPNQIVIRQYGPGESFGEIALLTNKGRSATVVCKDDTHFMSVSKEGFDKVFSVYKTKMFDDQIEFLRNYSFFKESTKFALLDLLYYLKIEQYTCSQIIYKEKEESSHMYFVRSGEVVLSKRIEKQNEYSNSPSKKTNQFFEKRYKKNRYVKGEIDFEEEDEEEEIPDHEKLLIKKDQGINQRVIFAKLGPNSYFGDHEIISSIKFREVSAVCTSLSCELYSIEKQVKIIILNYNSFTFYHIQKLKALLSPKDFQILKEESINKYILQEERTLNAIGLKKNLMKKFFSESLSPRKLSSPTSPNFYNSSNANQQVQSPTKEGSIRNNFINQQKGEADINKINENNSLSPNKMTNSSNIANNISLRLNLSSKRIPTSTKRIASPINEMNHNTSDTKLNLSQIHASRIQKTLSFQCNNQSEQNLHSQKETIASVPALTKVLSQPSNTKIDNFHDPNQMKFLFPQTLNSKSQRIISRSHQQLHISSKRQTTQIDHSSPTKIHENQQEINSPSSILQRVLSISKQHSSTSYHLQGKLMASPRTFPMNIFSMTTRRQYEEKQQQKSTERELSLKKQLQTTMQDEPEQNQIPVQQQSSKASALQLILKKTQFSQKEKMNSSASSKNYFKDMKIFNSNKKLKMITNVSSTSFLDSPRLNCTRSQQLSSSNAVKEYQLNFFQNQTIKDNQKVFLVDKKNN